MNTWDMIGRLVIAVVCSGAIGFEREAAHKAAGLRTHIMVGLGAATFAVLAMSMFDVQSSTRIIANVVTGIGFLGAGAIFRQGPLVKGLTTAAGLWTVAAIGLAAGSGAYGLAAVATVIVLVVLYGLEGVDRIVARRAGHEREEIAVTIDDAGALPKLLEFVHHLDDTAREVGFERSGRGGVLELAVKGERVERLIEMIGVHQSVTGVERAP